MGGSFRKPGQGILRGFPLLQMFLWLQSTVWNNNGIIKQRVWFLINCTNLAKAFSLENRKRNEVRPEQFALSQNTCMKRCYVFNCCHVVANLEKFTTRTESGLRSPCRSSRLPAGQERSAGPEGFCGSDVGTSLTNQKLFMFAVQSLLFTEIW